MKEPVDHILRPRLPWRSPDEGAITECGYDATKVKTLTRAEFFQRHKELGERRTAIKNMTPGELCTALHRFTNDNAHNYSMEWRWLASLMVESLRIAEQRGYKVGWAAVKFKKIYNEWPPWDRPPTSDPSAELLWWVKRQSIEFAKMRDAADGGKRPAKRLEAASPLMENND